MWIQGGGGIVVHDCISGQAAHDCGVVVRGDASRTSDSNDHTGGDGWFHNYMRYF